MSSSLGIDGIVSGLDTTSLIEKLMELENTKLDTLNTKKDTLTTEADAWRELNTLIYAVQEAAYDLQSLSAFRGRTVGVSDETVLTATSSDGALAAGYSIDVSQLAKAHILSSDAQTSEDTALNLEGTFQINDAEVTVTTDDTLSSIAAKINSASDSVYASVVQVNTGSYKLVLTGRETGEDNQISLTDSESGSGILTKLGVLDASGDIANEVQEAQDALLTVNGLEIQSSSNTVEQAISGVTLNLLREGSSVQLTVSQDTESIVDAVSTFVEKYNAVMEFINENTTYTYDSDTEEGTAGPLFGDATLTTIQSTLKSYLSMSVDDVDSSVSALALIGISTGSGVDAAVSGLLEFDEDTFREALESNYDDIAELFGSTSTGSDEGIFSSMYDKLYEMTSTGGTLDAKTDTIDDELDDLNEQIEEMEDYLEEKEESYYDQFSAMELALSKLQTQSDALTSLLDSLSD